MGYFEIEFLCDRKWIESFEIELIRFCSCKAFETLTSCDEKQRNLQRSEVSEALRVDRLDEL